MGAQVRDPAGSGLPLSVVIPCFNEQENVRPVYDEICQELAEYESLEVLFVDDGSTDDTLSEVRCLAAQDSRVSYVSLTRNCGFEAAFSAGYRYAHHPWVLHLDADLQFPPSATHDLVAKARDGYDAVFGVRSTRQDSWRRRAASRLHEFVARRILGIRLPPGATAFRLVRADLARRIVDLGLGTPYFLATVPQLTSRWTTVTTPHRARLRGHSKVTFRELARHALGLFIGYSWRPLQAGILVAFLSAVSFLGAMLAMMTGHSSWGATLGAVGGMGCAGTLAVLCAYVMLLRRDQARPPQFLIAESNFSVRAEDLLDRSERGAVPT